MDIYCVTDMKNNSIINLYYSKISYLLILNNFNFVQIYQKKYVKIQCDKLYIKYSTTVMKERVRQLNLRITENINTILYTYDTNKKIFIIQFLEKTLMIKYISDHQHRCIS